MAPEAWLAQPANAKWHTAASTLVLFAASCLSNQLDFPGALRRGLSRCAQQVSATGVFRPGEAQQRSFTMERNRSDFLELRTAGRRAVLQPRRRKQHCNSKLIHLRAPDWQALSL